MSKLSFEEWFNKNDTKCSELLKTNSCRDILCFECEFDTGSKAAWNFYQKQNDEEIDGIRKQLIAQCKISNELLDEKEKLEEQILKMRCCENCKNFVDFQCKFDEDLDPKINYCSTEKWEKWELKE